jgi:hypothetical protein
MKKALGAAMVFLFLPIDTLAVPARIGKPRNEEEVKVINMPDAAVSGQCISFRQGKLIPLKEGKGDFSDFDLVWELPSGLGANNSATIAYGTGKGGIIDLGDKKMSEVKVAPKTGYLLFLKADQIRQGHTYCVRTRDGKHYGKIHITRYDVKQKILIFTWEYQPKLTRRFD